MTTYSPVKTGDFALKELDFASLAEFLKHTAGEDRQFFLDEELRDSGGEIVAPTVCGMANGAGGWIVIGAVWDESENKTDVHGVSDIIALRERLIAVFSGQFSVPIPVALYTIPDSPVLLLHVWPVPWYNRPVCVNGDYVRGSWRRIEGVNVASGLNVRFRLGMDALEHSRSDLPMADVTLEDFHTESVAAFREAVVRRQPDWRALSLDDFLSRTLVTSDGRVTQAGYLLLGRQAVHVRAELQGTDEAFEVRNLWRAWSGLLPRLTRSLSAACAAAFRECFVNALIHAEHDASQITITVSGGAKSRTHGIQVCLENPGLARAWRSGDSECRNFRLMKMFQLFGAARGTGEGLDIIRHYAPDFRLDQNILKLTTVARLRLEPRLEFEFEPDVKVVSVPSRGTSGAANAKATNERETTLKEPQILLANENLEQGPSVRAASVEDTPSQEFQTAQRISFGSAARDLENFVAGLRADKTKSSSH